MGKPPARTRLDQRVLECGLAPSRTQAQALILAGRILADGQKLTKPGAPVAADCQLSRIGDPPPYASRAGGKLAAALDAWSIAVEGRVALDIGSSTGGFTDCLLQRGALRVHAVDAGTNQMIWELRHHPRVHLMEQTNARFLEAAAIGEPVSLLVIDVSFISVTLLLPALAPLLEPAGDALVLVKPQFEAGRAAVGRGGIVRDPASHAAAVERVAAALVGHGFAIRASMPSPVLGAEGNQEFLLWGVKLAQ